MSEMYLYLGGTEIRGGFQQIGTTGGGISSGNLGRADFGPNLTHLNAHKESKLSISTRKTQIIQKSLSEKPQKDEIIR